MAAINLTSLLLVTLLCFTTLTLSVGTFARPDGTTTTSSPSRQEFLLSKSSSSPMVKRPATDPAADNKKISKDLAGESIMIEGGPISISTSTQRATLTATATGSEVNFDNLSVEKITKERTAVSSVVARKGVEPKKIKGRKGVNETGLDPSQPTVSFSQTTVRDAKFIDENTSTMAAIRVNDQSGSSNVTNSMLNTTDSQSNDSLKHSVNSNVTSIPVNATSSRAEIVNSTTMQNSSLHTKKHIPKPKPTVTTVGRTDTDSESRSSLQIKSPLSGAPRKIDYIVPVIVTIFAVPLLGTAIFVLYTRGRDCWDKRHYRRMDFLIDGMYND